MVSRLRIVDSGQGIDEQAERAIGDFLNKDPCSAKPMYTYADLVA